MIRSALRAVLIIISLMSLTFGANVARGIVLRHRRDRANIAAASMLVAIAALLAFHALD